MLIRFFVKNYASYKEEAILDLEAVNIAEFNESLIQRSGIKGLPVVTMYGPNASGKSNFLRAFGEFCFYILHSAEIINNEGSAPYRPFLFDRDTISAPTEYEVEFIQSDLVYRYGFVVGPEHLAEEYLYVRKSNFAKFVRMFERTREKGLIIGTTELMTKEEREYLKTTNELMDAADELLLTLLGRRGKKVVRGVRFAQIYSEFEKVYFRNAIGSERRRELCFAKNSTLKQYYEDGKKAAAHLKFVQLADHCIQKLGIELKNNSDDGKEYYEVTSLHEGAMENVSSLIESDGTKNAIVLYPMIDEALSNGGVLIIDEMDGSLHPMLLLEIIRMFMNPEVNKNGAQLICSLHNVIVMDKKHLRRDQIWLVDKNESGESEIYSLTDIELNGKKVRNDADYCKQYILGNYGAVPKFGKIEG